jgi:hypothetical protein
MVVAWIAATALDFWKCFLWGTINWYNDALWI